MMKRTVAALGILTLTACGDLPQDADGMRSFAAAGSSLTKKTSKMIARAPSQVYASLQRGTARCLTTSQTQSFSRATQFGIQTTNISHGYSGKFQRTGGKGVISVYKRTSGAITPGSQDGGYMAYVVDAVPAPGGTRLDFYGGRMGYGDLNAAVSEWASGGPIRCPSMP